jgi:phospholipid transport system substrate-binding protein
MEKAAAAILEEVTDYSIIVDRVKSSVCQGLPEAKSSEFANAFSQMIKLSYSKKIAKLKLNEIEYLDEKINGSTATVKTKVKGDSKDVKIDYTLEKINGKWLITNYIIDDINTVDNYKKQFKRLLKKDSIDSVIKNLNKKIQELKSGKDD